MEYKFVRRPEHKAATVLMVNGALLMALQNGRKWNDISKKVVQIYNDITCHERTFSDEDLEKQFGCFYTHMVKTYCAMTGTPMYDELIQHAGLMMAMMASKSLQDSLVSALGECLWRLALQEGVTLNHFLDYRAELKASPVIRNKTGIVDDLTLDDLQAFVDSVL